MLLRALSRLSFVFFACLAAPNSGHAQRLSRVADKAFEIHDFAEAAEGYDKVLRKDPNDVEARYRYAYSLRVLGRLEEAEAAIKVLPEGDNPEVYYQHALILTELGRYPEAVEQVFRAAKKQHPMADGLAARLTYAQAHGKDLAAWKVSNEFANASGDDFAPEAFGDFVVFASNRNGGGTKLYRSVRDENKFLRVPDKVHRVGEVTGGEAPVAYAPSGELIAYTRNNFVPGERLIPEAGWELNLVLALPTQDNDFLPGKAFVQNGAGYNTGFPSFSPDGKRLFFASDRPGGHGGYDLYYSEREDNGWGAPVNLGPEVNTPGNEIAPQTASGSVYFSSDYLPGFGGMDIYRADVIGGVVSSVSNLGPAVNSPLDDIGFSLAEGGDIAYFASNRAGGKGGLDLYRAVRSGQAITLAVIDGKTRKPVANAILDFSDCGQGIFLTGADGAYTFRALPTLDCRPVVRKTGFNSKEFSLVAANMKDRPRMEIVLNPEDKITAYGGKVVNSRTGDAVRDVVVAARHKNNDFTAEARTDESGNYELSLERAGDYVIAYTAAGMAKIDREVSTYESDGAGVLSTFAMFPDGSAAAAANARQMTVGTTTADDGTIAESAKPTPRAPQPGQGSETRSVPSEKQTAVTEAGDTSTEPTTTPAPCKETEASPESKAGVAVQVAAVSTTSADLSKFTTRLSGIGPVYGRVVGSLFRVRVGPFADREIAVAQLAKVKAAGYGDAFLVTEVGDADSATTSANSPAREQLQPKGSGYFVRLATYRTLSNFDQAKAAALGDLTTRRSGENVVVLLQGFASVAEAQARLEGIRSGGYPDAVVVQEAADGSLLNVK